MHVRSISREQLAAFAVCAVLGATAVAWARRGGGAAADKPIALDARIPEDSSLVSGQLSNRLRYFVWPNGTPQSRAELRLVINAGSALEADDQRGLAHAVEHMLFRGTTHFPGHAVDDYLESIGMRAGDDINASTSFDETIVRLTVPTDRAGVLDTSVAILADMAGAARIDPAEARQEAGVVFAEWLSRSGASQRLYDERTNILLAGSPYAGHPVIGDTAVLRRFDPAAMRRFYKDWYRPDLMAVVVVGDVDAIPTVRLIKKYFGSLHAPDAPQPRPQITVHPDTTVRAAVLRDPEATAPRVSVWHPTPAVVQRTLGDYRQWLIDELLRRSLRERLDDVSERADSPILEASAISTTLARSLDASVVSATVAPGRERAAVAAIAAEMARLARFGLPADELARRGAAVLREDRAADERADRSPGLADQLVDAFLTGGAVFTRASSYELTRDLLPTIHTADVLARARTLAVDSAATIIVTESAAATAAGSVASIIADARAAARDVEPEPSDSSASMALVPTPPAAGRIASERALADVRAFEWTLGNGMRVILKPTRFSVDDIELRAFLPGGASLASRADFSSAYLADAVISSTGVGPVSGTELTRRLDPTTADFSATVGDEGISFTGSAAPRDLETLFQVFYLHAAAARSDTVAFRRYQRRTDAWARGRSSDPDAVFTDSAAAAVSRNDPRALRSTERFVHGVSLARALEFWNARMRNASGFTVVLTGDFTLDRVRPLVEQYLASLPAGQPEHARDLGTRFPDGIVQRRIVAGLGPKARTQITISGPFAPSNDEVDRLEAVRDLAELTLDGRLRQRLGGTYGTDVSIDYQLTPPATYTLSVDFEALPNRIDSLAAVALQELHRLATQGPDDGDAAKVRAARLRDLDGRDESNRYWANELAWYARLGSPFGAILSRVPSVNLISRRWLTDACAAYLRTSGYVRVTMVPTAATVRKERAASRGQAR